MDNKSRKEESQNIKQEEIIKALKIVEKNSLQIAQIYSSLFASLQLSLSHSTNTSVDYLECFNDASHKLQQSATDAATRGNRLIHSCIRLNEEMKDIDSLAAHIKLLKKNVDTLDLAVNRLKRIK